MREGMTTRTRRPIGHLGDPARDRQHRNHPHSPPTPRSMISANNGLPTSAWP